MWNEAAQSLVEAEELVVIGVVQEQHAERARLYKQWKRFQFPIAQDAFTEIGLAVVPVPVLIDEYGMVMATRIRPNGLNDLVLTKTREPASHPPKTNEAYVSPQWLKAKHESIPGMNIKIGLADAYLRERTYQSNEEAIALYESMLADSKFDSKKKGLIHFRLGVAYRNQFDWALDEIKDPESFTKASEHWSKAVRINPNQYIWRRRIQQYGPRLSKPYPFYDWVEKAQKEIADRGDEPIELVVPLSGAEIAQRSRKFESVDEDALNPDPSGKVTVDSSICAVHSTTVPSIPKRGEPVRVHLRFETKNVQWNNEGEDMVVWVNGSEKGKLSLAKLVVPNPKDPTSIEPRTVEFEFKVNSDADSKVELSGFALVNVCEKENGQCLYRRIDFTVPINIGK